MTTRVQFGKPIGAFQLTQQKLAEIKDLGATFVRAHYPLHPYFQERADALGILHENPPEVVERVLELTALDGDTPVRVDARELPLRSPPRWLPHRAARTTA